MANNLFGAVVLVGREERRELGYVLDTGECLNFSRRPIASATLLVLGEPDNLLAQSRWAIRQAIRYDVPMLGWDDFNDVYSLTPDQLSALLAENRDRFARALEPSCPDVVFPAFATGFPLRF